MESFFLQSPIAQERTFIVKRFQLFNSLLKVDVCQVPNPNKRSCSVWLIHLEWDRFEYQMRKIEVVVLLSVIVSMGQRFGRTIKHTTKATYIFQIMLMHLHQVALVYMESFRVLKENQGICSSRAVKDLSSMITKCSSCTSCKACTKALSKVRLAWSLLGKLILRM